MLLASTGSAQRTWMYYSNAKSHIGQNTILNVQGTAQRPMSLRFDGNSRIDNNGRIFLYGDFVNNVPAGQPNVFVFPKAPDPIQSELRFLGDSISFIEGTTETRFNNLYINKVNHGVPVVQKLKSFIDEPSILTIDYSQLSNCYTLAKLQYPAAHMVVLNTDPKAVISERDGFVGADDDSLFTDRYVERATPFKGGRLVWHMKDHAGEEYVFPVGNINLAGQYRRDVTIVNKNAEERVYAVRCVGKDAESDAYNANHADNPTVCKVNQFFYHIIDDSTDLAVDGIRGDTTRMVDLKIQYLPADGVFNDMGVFDNLLVDSRGETDIWKDLRSKDETSSDGLSKFFFKEDWNDFDHPVFALYPVKALDGLSLTKMVPPGNPSDPYFRNTDKIKLEDNPDNIDGLEYEWKVEYLDKSTDPPRRILVGEPARNRFAEFPSDFKVEPGPPSISPGEYCFSVRVKNPAAPPDEECEGTGDTCIFILPDRVAYVPTGFSPNSDGTNNEWKAQFYGFKEVSVEIFNRWGLLIYTKTIRVEDGTADGDQLGKPPKNGNSLDDKQNGVVLWNGKTKDGDPVPEGAYVYNLRMIPDPPTPLEKVWQQNGMVTVVR